jgi:hypothetical protein
MKLVVVAAFVVMNAVGFLVYRASYTPDAAASSLPTSKPEAVDNLSRDEGASQVKVEDPSRPPVAARPTSEPHVTAPAISAEESVPAHTNSPTGEAAQRDTPEQQRARVKHPVRKRVEETPAPAAKAVATTKPAETKPAPETKPVAETKPPVETKSSDKTKDKVLEMEANPYKRGE